MTVPSRTEAMAAMDAYFESGDDTYIRQSEADARDAARHLLRICLQQWWGANGPGSGYENAAETVLALLREVADELGMPTDPTPARHSLRKPFKAGVTRRVWDRDDWTCRHCGTHRNLTVDHIKPVSKGGTNDLDNLQTLCGTCNNRKNDRE